VSEHDEIMRAVGRLEACADSMEKQARQTRADMIALHANLSKRVSVLEAFRNRVIGYSIAVTAPVAAGAGWITNLLSGGNPPTN
jgi:hypothetical protein